MINTNSLNQDIKKLIAAIIETDADKIDPDANLVEDLGMDSMMALEILAALEKKYKIKIPEVELAKITTLNRVIEITRRYVR